MVFNALSCSHRVKSMEDKKYFTVKQVADYFNASIHTVYFWINTGLIGYHRLGKRYRITEDDIRIFEKRSHNRAHQERAL